MDFSQRAVVVLGLTVNGLGVLRSLGPLGVRCFGIYSDPRTELGRHSRFMEQARRLTEPPADDAIFEALDELTSGGSDPKPVLIPTADVYAGFIANHQSELDAKYRFRSPSKDLHDCFLDKAKTIEICTAHDVPIPVSLAPESVEDLSRIERDCRFPVIVKPRDTFRVPFPGKNFVAGGPAELARFFERRPGLLGQTVVQEVVESGDGNIVVAASYSGADGKVMAIYTGRKIRQFLPDYGVTCFGISETRPEIAELTRRFLDGIGYRGFAALEFAHDRATDRYYFLELNTRTYYHNQLFSDANVDVTRIGFLEMCGLDDREHVSEVRQRDGVVWLDFDRDLRSFYRKRRAGTLTFWPWFRSLFRASSFAYLDRRDMVPLVMSALHLLIDIAKHLVQRDEEPAG